MKNLLILFTLLFMFMETYAQEKKFKNFNDSLSYAFGISIVNNLNSQKIQKLNTTALAMAFDDFYKDKPAMSSEEANVVVQTFFQNMEAKKHQPKITEGKKFLDENAKKEGVIVTKSGLQYKIIKSGTGMVPKTSDKVKVHYEGTLINGNVFDSSYERGTPAVFGVTQVIKGWTEILQLMKEGAKYEVFIPYNLAYGERGAGKDIEPFSTLIFTVELISIEN